MKSLQLICQLIQQNQRRWWLFIILFSVAYYLVLMASLIITFENVPNYINVYNWPGNALEIFRATPSFKDAINILSDEWLLEIGYMNYDFGFGISEWSLNILPFKWLLVMFLGAILITHWRLWKYFNSLPCATKNPRMPEGQHNDLSATNSSDSLPAKSIAPVKKSTINHMALASGSGTLLVGMANMTMFWVVCCASPSWVVGLAMLGLVSVPVALLLDPWEIYVTMTGFSLLLMSLLWLAKAAVNASGHDEIQKNPASYYSQATKPGQDFANV